MAPCEIDEHIALGREIANLPADAPVLQLNGVCASSLRVRVVPDQFSVDVYLCHVVDDHADTHALARQTFEANRSRVGENKREPNTGQVRDFERVEVLYAEHAAFLLGSLAVSQRCGVSLVPF